MLHNSENSPLTAEQIAAHLHTKTWNVSRELRLGDRQKGSRPRLRGVKVLGEGVGAGGQWRVERDVYLTWLQIPAEDRGHLGPDGLPELVPFTRAAAKLGVAETDLRELVRTRRYPHIVFGRNRYLTHNQLEHISVQLIKDPREATPGGSDPGALVT